MEIKYAGFWARVVAYIIDYVLLNLIMIGVSIVAFLLIIPLTYMSASGSVEISDPVSAVFGFSIIIITFLVRWFYFAMQHSSKYRATLGMRAMGFHIEGENGEKVSFGQASGRYFAGILSTVILCIGYFMIGWTKKKQGLHDMLAGTYTVYDQQASEIIIGKETLKS